MLLGLHPLLSPDLLHALSSMGHGDEIVLVDANFPAASHAQRLVRMPGTRLDDVLAAVLSVMPLDSFVDVPAYTMQVVGQADSIPDAVASANDVLVKHGGRAAGTLERFAFYERARGAYAVVATGDPRAYGNVLLRKGVVVPA
jgi:L-fucose mutarotase